MDLFAFYLPQYHQTKENDLWWGEGFTEWENLKKAKALFSGHEQPKVPLNENYYDLSDVNVMEWQAQIALNAGITGFCVYHYWFEGKKLLHKPMEQLLDHKGIDFPYFFCWANESWTNTWAKAGGKPQILMRQTYGNQDNWEEHFQYLLPFFKDDRYIKKNNKLLFVIYRPEMIPCLNDMLEYFTKRSREEGFDGFIFMSQQVDFLINGYNNKSIDYRIEYQPAYAEDNCDSKIYRKINHFEELILRLFNDKLNIPTPKIKKLKIKSYDKIWHDIINHKPLDDKVIPGAFVGWDNTPRYREYGKVIQGCNPSKFEEYFRKLIKKTKEEYKKDMIFIFAWNEWTEGGYLEPDNLYEYGFLNAIHKALEEENEL